MAAMLALSCAALVAFPEKSPAIDGGIRFTDVTKKSGLNFQQSYGDRHLDNIVEGTGTGVCVFDYNNDGFMDVYFPNGKWTQGLSDDDSRDLRGRLTNHLFRNNGNGTFTDVTVEAGLGGSGYSVGCAAADYDNDGNVDLLVLNYGQNELFHNDGNGRFTEVSTKAGLTNASFSLSAIWYDYNNDGYLDLYIGNYVKYDRTKGAGFDPAAGYPGPLSYSGQPNLLYRNNGDGTFTDVTKEMGLWKPDGRSMSVTTADFHNDARLELLSTNDAMANYFFEMNARGVYQERAIEMNLAYGDNGENVAHMGPVVGDINRDGWLDIYIANLRDCSLLMQRPDGRVDLVVVNLNDKAILLRNETRTANHWITVTPRLKFPTGVRDAYGARVTVEANGRRMIEDMIPTRGYLSAQDPRLNFGLGKADHADSIEIRWPDGQVEKFKNVPGDRFVVYMHPATSLRVLAKPHSQAVPRRNSAGQPAVTGPGAVARVPAESRLRPGLTAPQDQALAGGERTAAHHAG